MSGVLDPDLLIRAYAIGVFPMADDAAAEDVFWVEPKRRGILPLDGFHLSRSLRKVLRQERFEHRVDTAFDAVVAACAERDGTWINGQIRTGYRALHDRGFAHSVECWREGRLVGGLYGVRLAGAFFGESMFTREDNASKAALAHLVARLRFGGFLLLDTQFLTDHLASLGAVEITRQDYRDRLDRALARRARFDQFSASPEGVSGKSIVQLLTQTS
ncbi:leucyl/phenylalanyl-tRNA--protein transferase [Pacificimonas flava]|uniref:Leucyl/phenylalanyl-tRNA--protein transferase n=2 Tax=Pacificimonas TaxID=1960290 RepID=A0A219B2F6_9SPHN|nr:MULTISPECIES: leucyl/phenylalanyl-tRNA--protein transferase [Pacificimonas]MBZ6378045.1 leucyl/phenylalanyl-tRNA--protein transferase [Pacificimonas aurantium]OWV32313.1 leucyl/phenylalanyl-tRNA--protein transferase [Pacificimonas flava]